MYVDGKKSWVDVLFVEVKSVPSLLERPAGKWFSNVVRDCWGRLPGSMLKRTYFELLKMLAKWKVLKYLLGFLQYKFGIHNKAWTTSSTE